MYTRIIRAISLVEVAETRADVGDEFDLKAAVEYFENSRDEDEIPEMEIENDRYAELIAGQDQDFESGVRDIFETLTQDDATIAAHEDRFLPGVLDDRTE